MSFLLFTLMLLAPQQADTLYAVDLYGLRSVPESAVRAAIGVHAGDPVPSSFDAARTRLRALPGVAEVDISAVCCSENGRTMLYVGIREHGTPPVTYRSPPTRVAPLPAEIVAAGNRLEAALEEAVKRGTTGEDHSKGYWLAQDSALRAVQQGFVRIAAQRFDTLSAVLHNSSDASQRALAAEIIAYGANRQNVLRELLYATGDPSDEVRNNAVRALGVLADWVNQNPQSGIAIPAAPFIDFLNSVSWTDRNKGVLVLMHLTAARDPVLLQQLRTRGLQSLIEMARWKNAGHALGPFIILARIAGTEDGEAFRAFQAGEREAVIARAQAQRRTEIRVWTARALATVLAEVGAEFERTSGHTLTVTSDLPTGFARRHSAGEAFDILITTSPVVDEWIKAGSIAATSRVNIARSGIGLAVREGARKPDIGTVDAFKRVLLDAKSIAYLKVGSGIHLDSLVERLGIAAAIKSKSVRPDTDAVCELVAKGEVDLGVVVITQILTTPGCALVGPLPPGTQSHVLFTAGVSANSRVPEAARQLLTFLTGRAAGTVMRRQGLEPAF